jgi:hypothetical protein
MRATAAARPGGHFWPSLALLAVGKLVGGWSAAAASSGSARLRFLPAVVSRLVSEPPCWDAGCALLFAWLEAPAQRRAHAACVHDGMRNRANDGQ